MAPAARTVRRLRLRAPSEAAVRRTVRVLEDALRTATLPDAGGRMLFVRRLALGRLAPDAQPVGVALALEEAVARVWGEWRHGDDAAAGNAAAVWFRDPLEVHVSLARRLLAGQRPEAWYWPLAVPAWNRGMTWAEGVRSIAHALGARVEAPAALPRWFTELSDAGYGGGLAAALREEDVERLARAARVDVEGSGASSRLPASHAGSPAGAAAPADSHRCDAVRRLIVAMVRVDTGSPVRPASLSALARSRSSTERSPPYPRGTRRPAAPPLAATRPGEGGHASAGAVVSPVTDLPGMHSSGHDAAAGSEGEGGGGSRVPREGGVATIAGRVPEARSPDGWLAPSAAGGLFFLLNALERTGYGEWLARQPEWAPHEVARRVLARVMASLTVPARDPAWGPVRFHPPLPVSPRRFMAPPRWRAGLCAGRGALLNATVGGDGRLYDPSGRLLLGGWRGPCPRPLIADRRGATRSLRRPGDLADEVVGAWEIALRRWLRRYARVSVAEIVLRPASVAATPTHVDVHFDLEAADPRIRRAGLDLDPGWVHWFGRVVTFVYQPTSSA